MITGLCDEYPQVLGRRRELFVGVLLVIIYLCALPTTTYVSLKKMKKLGKEKQNENHLSVD